VRVEVVLEDMGVRKNGAKVQVAKKYSFACLRAKL
jgi:hypothetical protein